MTQDLSCNGLPEIWGGLECTVNRVGDAYHDQLRRSGHDVRLTDLERFAELGIRSIRYPVLWEHVAPEHPDHCNWRWTDERLGCLRELGLQPIAGLVHHGSGPPYTSLVDPDFPEKLAQYAARVAERYPWLSMYTPVNEPLTTARFSGLYGHWYPHGRENRIFIRALLNQCRGIILAMRAIRRVNPDAELVLTEDLGKTLSTPLLAYQADFENERRWLSIDLLCGRITGTHPLWEYLVDKAGATEAELRWFEENPCPPSVFGINHYITSNRFLDERCEAYPEWSRGGNGEHAYADIESVRAVPECYIGHEVLLREAYERAGIPVAVTEAHLGCSREEQMRWLLEAWDAACRLHTEGVPVRAVTAWSLLGAFDWNTLVTEINHFYEPGVFDVRGGRPRPTVLAGMLRAWSRGREFYHPVLAVPGWWRRPERLWYPEGAMNCRQPAPSQEQLPESCIREESCRPLAIIGARGTLGKAFARICDIRGIPYLLLSRNELDIGNPEAVEAFLSAYHPWAMVNAAGYVRVDDAEREASRCWRENYEGPINLAECCARQDIPLVTFSTDLVFDGTRRTPYLEEDAVNPVNMYGRSKAEAELRVAKLWPRTLIVRTSAFFGPWDEYNFVTLALRTLAEGRTFRAAEDQVVSPTYVPELVNACLDLLMDGESGLWHLSCAGEISWAELARMSAEMSGLNARRVEGMPTMDLGLDARRPAYSALGSSRGLLLPTLENALAFYIREVRIPQLV